MKKVFFITTAHLSEGLWFRDDEDFKVGMNFVAIQAWRSGVVILSFVLMSNHLHFVLIGTEESVHHFINELKRRYSVYLRIKYGNKEFLRSNDVDVREISLEEDESIERTLAYVQMNPVAANICSHPSQYPWGTGRAFFDADPKGGKRLDEYSGRALKRILHSFNVKLPDGYRMSEAGYILPESYIGVEYVEKVFQSPRRMNYFLNSSSKARRKIETVEKEQPAFKDQVILSAIPDLCRSLFRKNSISELSDTELTELFRQIRYRFNATPNQIARVTGYSYEYVAKMLDRE